MMATTEERLKILKMIEDEKITAEEGAKLLSLLGSSSPKPPPRPRAGSARTLRVRVTDVKTGRSKASVQIPLSLVDAGMKIGAHFAPEIEGVELDQVMEAFQAGMTGKIIDVVDEQDGEHVEIFID